MIRLVRFLTVGILAFGLFSGLGSTNTDASTVSQASYKLTAYNSHGKKVNVNASKGLVVKRVPDKSWYKGSLKYTTYKKVNGKWKKVTKTSTIYIQASKIKKYTKITTVTKPVTTTEWVKKIKTIKGWFTNREIWEGREDAWEHESEEVKTGDVVPAGTMIMRLTSYDSEGYGAESLPSQDKYGKDTGRTEVLTDAVLTQDKIHPELGYADVKYVDYDPQK